MHTMCKRHRVTTNFTAVRDRCLALDLYQRTHDVIRMRHSIPQHNLYDYFGTANSGHIIILAGCAASLEWHLCDKSVSKVQLDVNHRDNKVTIFSLVERKQMEHSVKITRRTSHTLALKYVHT